MTIKLRAKRAEDTAPRKIVSSLLDLRPPALLVVIAVLLAAASPISAHAHDTDMVTITAGVRPVTKLAFSEGFVEVRSNAGWCFSAVDAEGREYRCSGSGCSKVRLAEGAVPTLVAD